MCSCCVLVFSCTVVSKNPVGGTDGCNFKKNKKKRPEQPKTELFKILQVQEGLTIDFFLK